jgi:hypothetical protein
MHKALAIFATYSDALSVLKRSFYGLPMPGRLIRQPPIRVNIRCKPWSVPRLRGRGKQG